MASMFGYYERRALTASERATITARLEAKGLKQGHGKWSEVFARHANKVPR